MWMDWKEVEKPLQQWAMSIWRSPAMARGSAIQIHPPTAPPLSFFVYFKLLEHRLETMIYVWTSDGLTRCMGLSRGKTVSQGVDGGYWSEGSPLISGGASSVHRKCQGAPRGRILAIAQGPKRRGSETQEVSRKQAVLAQADQVMGMRILAPRFPKSRTDPTR
ncbi:uncharacterized protein LDX57_007340 [Aspergillus melleus]|uniref:uncharacterized protein n=1 Tax=Aspergillus melleus TaxID=138277 RepID=UPI001E8E1EC5|nr:uncharacterized protein LDX57_007340 [Aspergillus melleus]KAH8429668.1 hypothetical protein LDX57_007340 [Aspergillus melleus]